MVSSLKEPGLVSEGQPLKNKIQTGFLGIVCPVLLRPATLCPREPTERGPEICRDKEKGAASHRDKRA